MKHFITTIAATLAFNAYGQQGETIPQKLNSLIVEHVEKQHFSGSTLLGAGNQIIYKKTVGLADRENNKPLTEGHTFAIGSITKMFTAVMVMQDVEKGTIKLDDTIEKFLKNTKINSANQITIRHLLNHTSGLGNYMEERLFVMKRRADKLKTVDDYLDIVEASSANLAPLGTHRYSNSGFILLGKILETVNNKPYKDLLEERIIVPLNLQHTKVTAFADDATVAQPYRIFTPNNFINFNETKHISLNAMPDGGLMMNAEDLYLFAQGLMSGKLVSTATLQQMINGKVETGRSDFGNYGLGIAVGTIDGEEWIGHSGYSMGYDSDLRMNLKEKAAIVALSNNNNCNTPSLNTKISSIIAGKEPSKVKQLLSDFLIQNIKSKGADYVTANIHQLLKDNGYSKLIDEWNLLRLADELDMAHMNNESLLIFDLNKNVFSNKPNAYKAYAEAMARRKMNKEAIALFNKALELNPKDDYTIKRLKELSE